MAFVEFYYVVFACERSRALVSRKHLICVERVFFRHFFFYFIITICSLRCCFNLCVRVRVARKEAAVADECLKILFDTDCVPNSFK